MKKVTLATLVAMLALPATVALAQQKMDDMKGMGMDKPAASQPSGSMKGMDMKKKKTAGKHAVHMAKGVVKTVDPATGTVTVAHDPVKSMKWPAMTMGFKVKDKMLLDKFTAGNKVEFQFEQEGKDYVVTAVK